MSPPSKAKAVPSIMKMTAPLSSPRSAPWTPFTSSPNWTPALSSPPCSPTSMPKAAITHWKQSTRTSAKCSKAWAVASSFSQGFRANQPAPSSAKSPRSKTASKLAPARSPLLNSPMPTESFQASRWTKGNFLFPTLIEVSELSVMRRKRHWFRVDEESITMQKVASVRITTGLVWADISIESSGGTEPIQSHGHRKDDAQRIKELIENYQAGRALGGAEPLSQT